MSCEASGSASLSPNKLTTAAGHSGFLQTDEGGRLTVLKPYDITEGQIYQQLSAHDDTALTFIPRFYGMDSKLGEDGKVGQFLCLENLLDGFTNPKIMDVKLGFRTFSESECECTAPRSDLFIKMLEKFPEHLSAEEIAAEAVTKHRWMTLRDANSTIASLGFRIDGLAGSINSSFTDINRQLSRVASTNDVATVFNEFARMVSTDERQHVGGVCPQHVAEKIAEQLQHMRHSLAESRFVQCHEFVGTSALIIADAYGKVRVAWIDFAKTQLVPEGMQLTHTDVWNAGNHEDGLLAGLDGLVRAWDMASILACIDEGQLSCSSMCVGVSSSPQLVKDGVVRKRSVQRETCLRSFSPQSWRRRFCKEMSRM